MAVGWRLAERLGWSALGLPGPAGFVPGAAGGPVAPGACPAVGAVVEGPPAVGVAAGLQPVPGAVALCVADDEQQGQQPGFEPACWLGGKAHLPAGADVQRGPGFFGDGLDGLQV